MKIPKKIKILGIPYKIKEVEYISREEFILGHIEYTKQKISLLSDLSKEKKEQALIHEILHGIFNAVGLDYTDEDTIQRIACALHQVIKDNPLLF